MNENGKKKNISLPSAINTVLFAIGAGLMGYCWFKYIYWLPVFPESSHGVIIGAIATMLAGFVFSLLVVGPTLRKAQNERTKIGQRAQNLEKQATTDPLTGMHNRRYFEEALKGYLQEFNRIGATLGLLILDLDYFKSVNDNYGHDVGDMVLKEVALRLRAICRAHDVVARFGGEEFALITPYTDRGQLLEVAERFRLMIEALAIRHGNIIIRPTVSIGVATNEAGIDNIDDLFKAADQKLYQAKHAGRNRVAA